MENIFILNNLEKNVLDMLSNRLLNVSVNHDTNIYMNKAILYGMSIPDRLRTFIQDFKNEKLKNDILIIKNLPVDENIITPESNKSYMFCHVDKHKHEQMQKPTARFFWLMCAAISLTSSPPYAATNACSLAVVAPVASLCSSGSSTASIASTDWCS